MSDYDIDNSAIETIKRLRAAKARIITDTIKWKQLACDRQHLIDTRDYQITTLTEQVKELREALEEVLMQSNRALINQDTDTPYWEAVQSAEQALQKTEGE